MWTGAARVGRDAVLSVTGLVKRFGDRLAVDGVSFAVAPGETYGLLGPNGAGKTTTIRMICGLLRAEAGEIVVAGKPVTTSDPGAKGLIGYVPQDVALYPDLTARENLRFFGRFYRLRGKVLDQRVDEVLELIGLSERARDRVDSFSGGMKRRLNIGAGLLHRPTLLVLDEPTVGVDPQSRHAVMESVQAFGSAVWRCCTRRTTWKRPNVSATASASWTRAGLLPKAPDVSWSPGSVSTTGSP